MPTITTVDVSWETTSTLDAAELRRLDTAMFLGDGSNNGVRGGIVRHGDNSLAVSVNGSDQVTVQAGAVVIPAATGLGVYRASLSAATAATAIDSRNATNPRIDLVVFRSSGAVDIITGTPGASPSAPALPANSIELARLNVPAVGGGAVTSSNAFRVYATGLGGTLYAESLARLPGSGNLLGQRAVTLDSGIEYVWNGTAWDGGWTSYTPTLISGSILGNGTLTGAYNEDRQGTVTFWASLLVGSTTSLSASSTGFSLPVPAKAGTFPVFFGEAFDVSAGGSITVRTTRAADTLATFLVPDSTAGGYDRPLTGLIPFAFVAGDRISIQGSYQRA